MQNRQKLKRKPRGISSATSSAPETKNPKSNSAFNSIVRRLARRDHSEKELRDKLKLHYTPEAINKAIQKAHDYKYIRPAEELSAIVARSLHRAGKGHFTVNQKLKMKGLPPQQKNSELEVEKANSLLQKKLKGQSLDKEQQQKLYRFLANRGFDHDTIMLTFKRYSNELEF